MLSRTTSHLLFLSNAVAHQAQFSVDLEKAVAVINSISGFIAKDFVHLLKREVLGLRNHKVDEERADEADQAEEDEGTVVHRRNHWGCGLTDLGIVNTQDERMEVRDNSYSEVIEPVG